MRLAIGTLGTAATVETSQTSYYTSSPAASIFTTPHTVSSGSLPQWIDFCPSPERTIALSVSAKPANTTFYAETGLSSSNHVLLDVRVPERNIFWGYAADPALLSKQGRDCLANAMSLLYGERPVLPAVLSRP